MFYNTCLPFFFFLMKQFPFEEVEMFMKNFHFPQEDNFTSTQSLSCF